MAEGFVCKRSNIGLTLPNTIEAGAFFVYVNHAITQITSSYYVNVGDSYAVVAKAAGVYRIHYDAFSKSHDSSNRCYTKLTLNGVDVPNSELIATSVSSGGTLVTNTIDVAMAVGDVLRVQGKQSYSGSKYITRFAVSILVNDLQDYIFDKIIGAL